jgi:hypothetical protein
MIKKVLGKAIAGTMTAGLLMVPVAGTVAPQVANVACNYPDTVATSLKLSVDKSFQRQGERNYARIRVRSGAGTPQGLVTFRVRGVKVDTDRLENGRATFKIPTVGKRGTFKVAAQFYGRCEFRNSSDIAYVTVVKKGRR